MEETEEGYRVSAVLEKSTHRLKLATDSWRKRAFADWWAATAPRLPLNTVLLGGGHGLPPIQTGEGECTDDTWRWTPPPLERAGHMAVWTGTEMIAWGGYNGAYLNTGGR